MRPAAAPALERDDVHVWLAFLGAATTASAPHDVEAALSPDERARAGRFAFERDRRRFAAARGILRHLLGMYLAADPGALAFRYGPRGKPALDAPAGDPIAFNLSHSDDVAVFAFSRRGAVGVDVEAIRPMADREELAERFFSPGEVRALSSVAPVDRELAFFTCWTRKEAYVKAVGEGLALPLDGFDVTCAPGDPPRLTVPGDEAAAVRWVLGDLAPVPGFAAALATEGPRSVSCWAWSGIPVSEPAGERVKEAV
jgi:4'-phosphopantetheinyl transferase